MIIAKRAARATTHLRLKRGLSSRASGILSALNIPTNQEISGVYDGQWKGSGEVVESVCPTTGEILARINTASPADVSGALTKSREAYLQFRDVPAPRRGEILRQIREGLAIKREELGALVTLEMGKIRTEGVGEVQEFIDICDYAVGLSRMMNGRVVASERPGHTILEVPNPLGVVAVLSAFNFPVAVYGWNLALSLAAGNATIWKPSPTTPLTSIAVTSIVAKVLEKNNLPGALAGLVTGGQPVGEVLVGSKEVDLVSFTGSERVGRIVGQAVVSRFGKSILELGGNNASIVMPDADLSLAVPGVFFGAVGTAGQRCTSTRRLFLHRDIADEFLERLQKLYGALKPGDPLETDTLLGPMHTPAAVNLYKSTIDYLRSIDADILFGGKEYDVTPYDGGNFVQPTIAVPKSVDMSDRIWSTETFAPILNVAIFDELEEAIRWNNAVPQGLSSSLWTRDLRNVGKWTGPSGSDAGIVNVNAGTSGAEIGASFGGNKSTGWGRESGGDAWKQYVRWSACTINFSNEAPLAQGVNFNVD
ncbi:succinate-semialdehyde dehydrogenase [Lentinula aff. detonsa]|uniref:aldehyde dehydrogenase (NAD(+)) n=1 Tax=Lentinula aff. detonsa TaxID=2804958 RepID=A0AA38NPQ1_9AGAR|nr:succinate-semialdehyde dehydrogenase [Lentinula aff. detonsa]